MILDGNDLGIGKINITSENIKVYGEERLANNISIYSKDESCMFSFHTAKNYTEFNELELNKRTNLITGNYDYVDEDDFYIKSKTSSYILTQEDVEIFITKIDENKFLLEFEAFDLSHNQLPTSSDDPSEKHLVIKTVLDFNTI